MVENWSKYIAKQKREYRGRYGQNYMREGELKTAHDKECSRKYREINKERCLEAKKRAVMELYKLEWNDSEIAKAVSKSIGWVLSVILVKRGEKNVLPEGHTFNGLEKADIT